MATFKITVAYDGTDFVGWQRQAAGTSIQGLIEDALGELDGRKVMVAGAGRTDAGVHALGQVATFTLARPFDAQTVLRAVNARLPAEVRVLTAVEVAPTFHGRFAARTKTYGYRIWNGEAVSPFERRYVWQLAGALDFDAMGRAARLFEGTHDFAAFQAAGGEARETVRTVLSSGLRIADCGFHPRAAAALGAPGLRIDFPARLPDSGFQSRGQSAILVYEIVGDGFLRHMVRTIVGSLVEVGRGRRPVEWVCEVLASRDRRRAGPTAPATGLFLVSIDYDSDCGGGLADEP
jgi:tRNA pseudouridine38-40 synthase